MDSQTRRMSPNEIRQAANLALQASPNDNLVWLRAERDFAIADRNEAFAIDNQIGANIHAKKANHLAECVNELEKLRKINADMTKVLVNRVLVALNEATSPPWKPTHRHYKGTLYRVTGVRKDASGDELIEGFDYDDAMGNRYFLDRNRFESHLDSGRPRYQVLYPNDVKEDR